MIMRVLKRFPYSADGRHVHLLEEGALADIRAELVEGLTESGFVGPQGVVSAAQAVILGHDTTATTDARRRAR